MNMPFGSRFLCTNNRCDSTPHAPSSIHDLHVCTYTSLKLALFPQRIEEKATRCCWLKFYKNHCTCTPRRLILKGMKSITSWRKRRQQRTPLSVPLSSMNGWVGTCQAQEPQAAGRCEKQDQTNNGQKRAPRILKLQDGTCTVSGYN